MKPYDGGAWRGVSRIRDPGELHRAYDSSGEMLMHLQEAIEGYDAFARALTIGAETMVMRLHYYFCWAIKALLKWSVFCLVTRRRPGLDTNTRAYFDIADNASLDYAAKLTAYQRLADACLDAHAYREFCERHLADLDARVLDWAAGPEFDRLLVDTVRATYPAAEHEHFVAHLRGLTGLWVRDEGARLARA
ncbi:MAG: hypothetical protein ACLQDY_07415 [Streptosporangiaceae bacterium]